MNEERQDLTGSDPLEARETAADRSMVENFRDVIVDPEATFEDVAERPKWVAPLIVLVVATLIVSWFMMPMWSQMQQAQLAGQGMSPEQIEQSRQMMETFKWVGLAMAPIMSAVIMAIWAFLFWGWGTIAGARNARYGVAFAAVVYSGLIYLIQSVAQAIVVVAKGGEQVAAEGGPPTFGVTLFLDRGDMSGLMWGMLSNINFFSIWYAVVIAIAGQQALKMSKGASWGFAVVVWVISGIFLMFQPGG